MRALAPVKNHMTLIASIFSLVNSYFTGFVATPTLRGQIIVCRVLVSVITRARKRAG